ncbi:MAG: glycosyltransferase family 2 protein [Chloroflexi bacterium]|nr:glycosyltransferase family 2 protein [Chloroflexota bacterium]
MDVGIVIVSYNTRELLRRCLETVYASEGDVSFHVTVVDNASSDGTVEMVRTHFPQVRLIANPVNAGYPYGNNLGLLTYGFRPVGDETQILQSPPDAVVWEGGEKRPYREYLRPTRPPRYALLLNPDTELPPRALADMVAFMDAHPRAGVAGPRLVRPDGSLDLACRRSFPTPQVSFYRMLGLHKLFPKSPRFARYNLTYLPETLTVEVDSVVGAFMMVRREAIEDAGLLDEQFFMYGEDLDWAYRIKQKGWQVWYNADVTVLHVKEAASRQSKRARVEFYRAMVIFYRKHYAATTPKPLHWLIMTGIAVKGTVDVLLRWAQLSWQRVRSGEGKP